VSPIKILALALVVAGILALAYGGFTYTRESHHLRMGDLDLSVKDHETVNVPVWVGAGAVVAGAALLLLRQRTV
jgi:TRAP-type C4-dicarboxylate transport system permease small subunit